MIVYKKPQKKRGKKYKVTLLALLMLTPRTLWQEHTTYYTATCPSDQLETHRCSRSCTEHDLFTEM